MVQVCLRFWTGKDPEIRAVLRMSYCCTSGLPPCLLPASFSVWCDPRVCHKGPMHQAPCWSGTRVHPAAAASPLGTWVMPRPSPACHARVSLIAGCSSRGASPLHLVAHKPFQQHRGVPQLGDAAGEHIRAPPTETASSSSSSSSPPSSGPSNRERWSPASAVASGHTWLFSTLLAGTLGAGFLGERLGHQCS